MRWKWCLAALPALLLGGSAIAAPTANSVIVPQNPNRGLVTFVQGTDAALTYKMLYAAGPNGSRCMGAEMTNNDGSATHVVTLQVASGSTTTASIAAATSSSTGSITGTVLNVTAISSGNLIPGETLSGTSVTAGTQIVNQINGNPGGIGNYNVTVPSTATSTTISGTYGTLTTTVVTTGMPTIGQALSGSSVAANTVIIGYGTAGPGTTGIGTYFVSPTGTTASTTITGTAPFSSQPVKAYGGTSLLSIFNSGFITAAGAQPLMTAAVWPGLPLDNVGNPFLYLAPGDSLIATFATALTSTDLLNIQVTCSDY